MDAASLTEAQLSSFSIIERVCSVLSLFGCVLVIGTFSTSNYFHKPINRLVFYASFGNMMTNVATLMARSYLGDTGSPGCQFQAFLIQMFMPADAFWTLAMAINVYLTFYYKFDSQKLRRMEIGYLIGCYGLPFIVALIFVFIKTDTKGRMYGNATLWCWVSSKWDIFRIATFYGPVWVVILLTFFIYARAGHEIYKKHKLLRDFSTHNDPEPLTMDDAANASKTTEVRITSEAVNTPAQPGIDLSILGSRTSRSDDHDQKSGNGGAYSVTISARPEARPASTYGEFSLPIQTNANANPATGPGAKPAAMNAAPKNTTSRQRRGAAYEANSAAWSYTKCAILFFTAMLVTWIPSSANRVYSVVHVDKISLPLEYMSAFVLPLQGFWNAIIYVVTSWRACQMLWDDIFYRHPRARVTEIIGRNTGGHQHLGSMAGGRGEGGASGAFVRIPGRSKLEKSCESESMTELASRSNSHERS